MKMPLFPDAAVSALLGYAVVFFGLVLLMVVVVLMGKVMASKKADAPAAAASPASPAAPAAKAPLAPGSAGQVALHGIDDKDAAMIMAIVANKMGKPLNQLRFKSIKEVE